MFKRVWDMLGWGITGYTVWKQFKGMDSAKNDFYATLSPEQQAEWNKYFGKPGSVAIVNPSMPQVAPKPVAVAVQPTQMEHVEAGT